MLCNIIINKNNKIFRISIVVIIETINKGEIREGQVQY